VYFDQIDKINIEELINPSYRILAHIKEQKKLEQGRQTETLAEHTELCMRYFTEIIQRKSLEQVFLNIEKLFFGNSSKGAKTLFWEMLFHIIIFHDIGKINPNFQKLVLKNDIKVQVKETNDSGHSLLSSIIYLDHFIKKAEQFPIEDRKRLIEFLFLNAYCISRHHGGLNNFSEFEDKFLRQGKGVNAGAGLNILESKGLFDKTFQINIEIKAEKIVRYFSLLNREKSNNREQTIAKFVYERLILSLLFASDFYSTTEFMDGLETKDFGEFTNFHTFFEKYQSGERYRNIKEYKKKIYSNELIKRDFNKIKDINILRNELFLESEQILKKNLDKLIFYLEAPTGSGKSNVALNLSLELLKQDKTKNKIFYVYPFNTLVEQNLEILKEVFGHDEFIHEAAVINSTTPIKTDGHIRKNEEEIKKTENYTEYINYYKRALLNRQFLNYPLVLTTHVTLFKYLFGTEKEDIFPIHQIANSVIVLDEIQSYKNSIWGEIISFLSVYAEVLNIKIIIMSATLPDLDVLSLASEEQKKRTVKLIKERNKYFLNPVFKERVHLDFSFLELEQPEEIIAELLEKVKLYANQNKKVLIEFIRKDRAEEFCRLLHEGDNVECEIELITGDYSTAIRNEILQKVKQKDKPMILVATQVVEAGVDIDMDIGFKNISLLDSEEQFLGRINRSRGKDDSIAYFFHLDDSKVIYKEDVRKQQELTLKNKEIQSLLKEKDFPIYYERVLKKLFEHTRKYNDHNIEVFFDEEVRLLSNYKIQKKMELIEEHEDKVTIFLNSKVKDIDGKILQGQDIWKQYKELLELKDMDYSEKRVKLSDITARMGLFTYEIHVNEIPPYSDRIGELYYIEDGELYLENDRFSRKKLKKDLFI